MTTISLTVEMDGDIVTREVRHMARKRKEDSSVEVAEPTGTVQARRKAKREADKAARAVRAEVVAETRAAQKATAEFLASKPTDSRKIADTRNVGG